MYTRCSVYKHGDIFDGAPIMGFSCFAGWDCLIEGVVALGIVRGLEIILGGSQGSILRH